MKAPATTSSSRLGTAARRRRGVATAIVGALLVGGSAVGSDDWFPLGPFRMFTNRAGPAGRVRVVHLVATDATGAVRTLGSGDVGLRHAELEGQLDRIRADPALLAAVAGAYASVHPGRPPLVEIDVREEVRRVEGGRLADEVEERTVAEWEQR